MVSPIILFLYIAELLGVKTFKKYWLVFGSYWNKTHINPKNEKDLLTVIDNTYFHTRNHIIIILSEILLSLYFTKHFHYPYLLITTMFHSYAFMIQLYNYILAKRALKSISV